MRLTLRYLLAYIDDHLLTQGATRILQPEEFEAVGKKVQDSDYAKSLMQRIRDVVRRVRLGAPSETERATGLDPNTVAEYLDNTLPDTRVPDFEKVCLESDVHLAEVACCHQILAMVVTEAAEVPDDTRERIYQLPTALATQTEEEEAWGTGETASEAEEEAEAEAERPPERHAKRSARQSRIPEYLRAGRGIGVWGRVFIAVGVLVLIVLAAFWMSGLGDGDNLLARLLSWRETDVGDESPSDTSAAPEPAAGPGESSPSITPPPAPKGREGEPGNLPSSPEPERSSGEAGGATKMSAETGTTSGAATQPPIGQAPGNAAKTPEGAPVEPGKSPQPTAIAPARPPAEPSQPSGEEMVGLVASTRQLVLRLNAKSHVWQRLADETPVYAGDRLLALPAFRPQLVLAGRVTLELVDATSLTLLPPVGKGPPGTAMELGRILARGEQAGGASLRVVVGDRSGVCRFADADSVVALEVSRAEASGDPETQPGPLVADLYVTSGKAIWREEQGGKEIELKASVRLTLSEQPLEPVVLQQQPRWVSGEVASALDQRAAGVLDREVMLGRSVMVALRELTLHRQREVRWLAMRCLSLVEDYEPLLGGLEDMEQYRFWSDYVDQLRAAIFRGPQAAAKVRTAMEQRYGPEGVALYEMLWKYRPDTLQAEDVNRLVDFLGNDSLPFRILSFWNLKNLYHNRTLYYRPDDPVIRRQAAIQKWRELLKASPAPRNSPAPLLEPTPQAKPMPVPPPE